MAKTHETIADIIAWLRRPREGENAYLTAWRDEIADRLEAAHKRERGDAAKLREALETARLFVTNCPTPLTTPLVGCGMSRAEVMNIIDAALAAPPRNCDRFTSAEEAFHAWNNTVDTPGGGAYVGLMDWLFAPATQGGNNGK